MKDEKNNSGTKKRVLLIVIVGILIIIGTLIIVNKYISTQNQEISNNKNSADENLGLNNEITDESEEPNKEPKVGEKNTKTSTIDGGLASESNPIIPKGYTPINTEEAKWDGENGPEYNKGLVIKDDNGNEWVWVPVADASVMYETANTPIELTGGEGNTYFNGAKVEKYSKSEVASGITRGVPNTTDLREPDVLVKSGSSCDAIEKNRETAGFVSSNGQTATLEEMSQTMVSEYEAMISSIEKYKGFYIGRYELTEEGSKKGDTLTVVSWYQLYEKCKTLSASDDVITRMIWGCQWDVTCNWLASCNYDMTDSSKWGNYKDYNTANGYEEGDENYEASAGIITQTGSSENWKANNIYDLAGNCFEWTQEGNSNRFRASRGGCCANTGIQCSGVYRDGDAMPTFDEGKYLRFSTYIVC